MAQQKVLLGHVKGDPGGQGEMGSLSAVTVTVDDANGVPSATGSVSGEPGEQTLTLDFKNLKGNPGDKGDTGNGITSIEKTAGEGLPGTKDTYTIHFDSTEDTTFEVYNGKDGSGIGDMEKSVYDTQGKNEDIFKYVDNAIGTALEASY